MQDTMIYVHHSLRIRESPAVKERQSQIHREIRSLYLAGAPLYTKEQIASARDQLEALNGKSGKVKLVGLTGDEAEFIVVDTGEIQTLKKGKQRIFGKPRIHFSSIEALTSFDGSSKIFTPSVASCSLSIRLVSTPYNKKTEDGGGSKTPESTVDATRDLFQAVSAEWAASQQCKNLVRVFESVEFPDVKQILAFACGSITAQPAALRLKATRRSMYQHALLITVCKLLDIKQYDKNPHPISAWAQDPVYSPIDAKVLGESGVKLLENPDGFLQLDNSTAVLSFSPNVPVKQIVTELCRPAVILWNEVVEDSDAGPGDGSLWCDGDSPRVREMISQYHRVDISLDPDLFDDVTLYIRRSKGA